MLSRRHATISSLGLIAVTAAAGVAVWPRLPAEMAIHFSLAWEPNTYVSKPLAVFLLPAIMLLTLAVLRGGFRVDPPEDPHVASVTTLSTMGLLAALHILVLAWNLGYPIPSDLVTLGILLWAVALVGYVIVRERGSSIS
ncbi:MAG: DUF1648 domain-containing protein [Euryarchaeota archaeon]|nr:DUF1648 domain-containing protein [Euryarchaeota archaeon]